MSKLIDRRLFGASAAGMFAAGLVFDDDTKPAVPVEADFVRDYEPPKFKLSWKKKQINRQLASDFVIFAHSNLDMVKKLYDREPGLLNATMDWGDGDWEDALGGASHMGRKDIVKFLTARERGSIYSVPR